jgi:hypothetical protein
MQCKFARVRDLGIMDIGQCCDMDLMTDSDIGKTCSTTVVGQGWIKSAEGFYHLTSGLKINKVRDEERYYDQFIFQYASNLTNTG